MAKSEAFMAGYKQAEIEMDEGSVDRWFEDSEMALGFNTYLWEQGYEMPEPGSAEYNSMMPPEDYAFMQNGENDCDAFGHCFSDADPGL